MITVSGKATFEAKPVARDEDLVGAARSGQHDAFAELVRRHENLVLAFSYTLARNLTESEEIAQESFVTAWQRLADLKRPEHFRSWLCGIVRNVHRTQRRNRSRRQSREDRAFSGDGLAAVAPSPLEQIISREEQRLVANALGEVPEVYRVALILYYREGQSIDKVAAGLDLTEETARKRLSLGRRLLQQHVSALVASVLERSRPGKEFTAAVMLAISVALARPASAAGSPTPGLKRTVVAGAAAMALVAVGVGVLVARPHPSMEQEQSPVVAAAAALSAASRPRRRPSPWRTLSTRSLVQPGAPGLARTTVAMLDFEDGVLSETCPAGELVNGPCPEGSRYCMIGALTMPWDFFGVSCAMETEQPIKYAKNLRVSFDYWVPSGSGRIDFQIWNGTKGYNFTIRMDEPEYDKWTHADWPLSDLKPNIKTKPGLDEGDHLDNFGIYGGRAGGKPLYVDNIAFSIAEDALSP